MSNYVEPARYINYIVLLKGHVRLKIIILIGFSSVADDYAAFHNNNNDWCRLYALM